MKRNQLFKATMAACAHRGPFCPAIVALFLSLTLASLVAANQTNSDAAEEMQAGELNRTYTYTDLGVLGDGGGSGELSVAYAINRRGQIVGGSTTDLLFTSHAFLWQNGQLTDLGAICPLQFCSSTATGVNNRGEIVGQTHVNSTEPPHAFLYRGGVMTDLGTGYGSGSFSAALGLNQADQVVGIRGVSQTSPITAFLYQDGIIQDLGTLGGHCHTEFCTEAEANAINDRGQIVGSSLPPEGVPLHAFVWENGVMIDLGTLGGNTEGTQAFGINNSGHVVGMSPPAAGFPHAVLWQGGTITDLGTLDHAETSYAYGINRFDQIVGTSDTLPGRFNAFYHAFLWERGRLSDLNGRTTNLPAGVTLQSANAINDRGQIVGQSCEGSISECESGTGIYHAFLLVPNSPR